MKKLPLLCILSFVFCIGTTFGYSSKDTSTANYLGDQGIVTKQTTASKYRLDDKILRQEVIGMALKVKGITLPENYTCKKYFADATKNDWVCRAVELAADNGIIARSNKYANPGKDVTRAEALAILMKAGDINLVTDVEFNQYLTVQENRRNNPEEERAVLSELEQFGTSVLWIQKLMLTAIQKIPAIYDPYATDCLCSLKPNRVSTRAEVFAFAKNITLNDLPKVPEFGFGNIQILPIKLSCASPETPWEEGIGQPLCDSDYYRNIETAYTGFLKAIKEKNSQKIVQYGTTLGAYNFGFSETKYRLFGDSFVGIIVGPQSWGSIMFTTYTVKNNTIVRQLFSTSDADYRDWENAILSNFQLKSLDDVLVNENIPAGSTKYNEIMAFANQYWYDRFEKMEIK